VGLEIERKFLVRGDGWRAAQAVAASADTAGESSGVRFRQGYVPAEGTTTVRVRLEGERGVLTIKARTEGLARLEYEYTIPAADALEMLDHVCGKPQIDKVRHTRRVGGHVWEIDEFLGENAGLVVAEIELDHEDEPFDRPDWLGEEVTHDTRYLNVNLAARPWRQWGVP
jgi:adenylate cyclase